MPSNRNISQPGGKVNTLILGAGITGLSCAYHLGKDYLVLEKESKAGGLCRSVKTGGFTFDYSGHLLHLHSDYAKKFIFSFLGKNIVKIERNSRIYSKEVLTRYPFQANLYGLPPDVIQECISGLLEAKRSAKKTEAVSRHVNRHGTFRDWVLKTFGRGFAKHFFFPYNTKLWTVSPERLTTDWINIFIPQPDVKDVIDGAFREQDKTFGYNASFYYPEKGGIQALIDSLSGKISNIRMNSPVTSINLKERFAITGDRKIYFKHLVSTIPLPELLGIIENLPEKVRSAGKMLSWNSVDCVNVGVKMKNLKEGIHWIYYPEKTFPFYRTGFYHNFTRYSVPSGTGSMYVETAYQPGSKPEKNMLLNKTLSGLVKSRVIDKKDKVIESQVLSIPYAYVIYDKNRSKALETINAFLKNSHIRSIGRYGAWKYSYIEESILDAKAAAENILKQ
ncbi:MAG: hypothetical protein A2297_04230 [Elusimicrobia bacterium RIFOXYB2_FULL_48_7]|nr:MAG: hypothetical protein A2297_04230 [Elusimicrobia bacterium RIFOXYB2_FULL_48_7]